MFDKHGSVTANKEVYIAVDSVAQLEFWILHMINRGRLI